MATTINEELIEKQVSVKDSVGDDDAAAAAEEDTSILQIMIEKEDEIRKSVSLIKKGMAGPTPAGEQQGSGPKLDEFKSLNGFLEDKRVDAIIGSVVGQGTTSLIKKTLDEINTKSNLTGKHEALASGLKQIHSNLRQGNSTFNENLNDSRLKLALSLLGLKKERLL